MQTKVIDQQFLTFTQEKIVANTRFHEYYRTLCNNRAKSAVMSEKEVEKGFDNFISFHILDALCALEAVNTWKGKRIIDIGSGAGIPGIPIYIYKKEDIKEAVLLEATAKKVAFLTTVKDTLHLDKLTVVNMRAEEAAKTPSYRETFDVSVIRAVGSIAESIEISLPFVKIGGVSLIFTGSISTEDVEFSTAYAGEFGGKLENTVNYLLNNAKNVRNIIVINKHTLTDTKFPRKSSKLGSKI